MNIEASPISRTLWPKRASPEKGTASREAIIIDREFNFPLALIEVKPKASQIDLASRESQSYADAFWKAGARPLAIGLAGTTDEEFKLKIFKRVASKWVPCNLRRIPHKLDSHQERS